MPIRLEACVQCFPVCRLLIFLLLDDLDPVQCDRCPDEHEGDDDSKYNVLKAARSDFEPEKPVHSTYNKNAGTKRNVYPTKNTPPMLARENEMMCEPETELDECSRCDTETYYLVVVVHVSGLFPMLAMDGLQELNRSLARIEWDT